MAATATCVDAAVVEASGDDGGDGGKGGRGGCLALLTAATAAHEASLENSWADTTTRMALSTKEARASVGVPGSGLTLRSRMTVSR